MDIAIQPISRLRNAGHGIAGPTARKRLFHIRLTEHTWPGAIHRNPDAAGALGDENARHDIAAGRVLHLGVAGLLRDWEFNRHQNLIRRQGSCEHALEEIISRDLALIGVDGGAKAEHRRRVISRRVVVGNRAANRAAIAHLHIANMRSHVGQSRNGRLHFRAIGDFHMPRQRADDDGIAFAANALHLRNAGQIHQR